jgi:hypothetical protein
MRVNKHVIYAYMYVMYAYMYVMYAYMYVMYAYMYVMYAYMYVMYAYMYVIISPPYLRRAHSSDLHLKPAYWLRNSCDAIVYIYPSVLVFGWCCQIG